LLMGTISVAAAAAAATATATTTTTAATTIAVTATAATTTATAEATTAAAVTATAAIASATTTAATATATATTTEVVVGPLTLLGLVHSQRTAIEHGPVHALNCFPGSIVGVHLDEGKAARAAGLTIEDESDIRHPTESGEGVTDHVLGRVEGEVAYVQALVHLRVSRRGPTRLGRVSYFRTCSRRAAPRASVAARALHGS
jgi:hypothetical protein